MQIFVRSKLNLTQSYVRSALRNAKLCQFGIDCGKFM